MRNYTRIARQLMLIAKRLLEAGKKERFDEYTSILKKKKFEQDEIDNILENLDGLQPAKKERVALHWIMNDALELPKDAKKLDKAFEYLELYKKKAEDYDDPDELIKFGEKRDTERTVIDDFNPNTCPEFSNKQNLGNGITVYDVNDTWDGMMAVRIAMDTSWGYDGGKWCLATRDHGRMDRAWNYWNNYNAYQKRIAFKNGKVYMFCANNDNELAWWNKNDKAYSYLPGAFDKRGYEIAWDYEGMADDPEMTAKDLKVLANDKNKWVREEIAKNPKTPVEILEVLANDKKWGVRYEVAKNPNTPVEILKVLVNDGYETVCCGATRNPNLPGEILKMLANDERDYIRYAVAKKLSTPTEVLTMLANDKNWEVRREVTYNPNTPVKVLKMLADDEDWFVRDSAARRLNNRI